MSQLIRKAFGGCCVMLLSALVVGMYPQAGFAGCSNVTLKNVSGVPLCRIYSFSPLPSYDMPANGTKKFQFGNDCAAPKPAHPGRASAMAANTVPSATVSQPTATFKLIQPTGQKGESGEYTCPPMGSYLACEFSIYEGRFSSDSNRPSGADTHCTKDGCCYKVKTTGSPSCTVQAQPSFNHSSSCDFKLIYTY